MKKRENQRITLTKRLLKDGLLRLLQKKSLDKINVSELCRESGINRATFYNHYETPHDVLIDVAQDIVLDLTELSNHPQSLQALREYLEDICSYLKEHSDLIKILISCNTDADVAIIFNNLNQSFWDLYNHYKTANKIDPDSIRLVSTFLSSGGYHLIRQWLMEDIPKTPKEIAGLIFGIISKDSIAN